MARQGGRFGKLPASMHPRTPRFERYLGPDILTPPSTVDTLGRVLANLHDSNGNPATNTHVPSLWPMDGNDRYGDCVAAAMAHLVTCWRGMDGALAVAAAGTVTRMYFALTGGQDSGLIISQTLATWHHKALLNQDAILGYGAIDVKDQDTIRQALALFGTLLLGFQVTTDTITQFDDGQMWTPGTLTGEGHAVPIVGYDDVGVVCLTWGAVQSGTWDWLAECGDELWVIVPPEARNKQYSGLALSQLIADMRALEP